MRIVWFLVSTALALITLWLMILAFNVGDALAPWIFGLSVITTALAFCIPFYAKAK